MSLETDVKKQSVPALVDLYILDLNSINVAEIYYFYPGTDVDNQPVQYLAHSYLPWPVEMTGFEKRGTGSEARPKGRISNIGGSVSALVEQYDDLVGAKLTRRRTLKTYVDANDPNYFDEIWIIEQKTSESALAIEFDLVTAMDFIDKKLPGRIAIANACPWRYASTANGSGCSWPRTNPSKYFDRNGNAVSTLAQDDCGKRLSDCKLRFGAGNPLDFGGFPSLGRTS